MLLLKNPNNIIQTGHNFYEKIDKNTIKTLCLSCGGKGFYLLMQGFPNSKSRSTQGELVSCTCEQGFKYQNIGMKHGNS